MTGPARALGVELALAGCGVFLAVDAWLAGSLFRYVLAGLVLGGLLCVPLATFAIWGRKAHAFWRRVLFAFAPVLVLLIVAELLFRAFGPTPELPATLAVDERLGHVVVGGTAGTDPRGFRNAAVPERLDVLVLGDSQTWGFGVDAEQTFTSLLGAATGRSVYQMANGSYGPVQYRELLRRTRERRPRTVVVAFYFGNDIVDAQDYTGLLGAEDLRLPDRAARVRHNPELTGDVAAPNCTMAMIDFVLGSSRLLDAAAAMVKDRLRGGMLDHVAGAVPFDHPSAATVLQPDYRFGTVDPENPLVQDGLEVTARCFASIGATCREIGAECLLLAIPTKEFSYAAWRGGELPELAPLHAAEAVVRGRILAAARDADLTVLDLEPELRRAMEAGRAPWRKGADGHLAVDGHRVASELLAAHLPR